MNAIISCKEHDHSRRQIYEICETDDGGEVSAPTEFLRLFLLLLSRVPSKYTVEPTSKYL